MQTRQRLLEAAGEAFAQHGFDQTNMRQVCQDATVNLGAVKYYFGSKEALYREVLVDAHRKLADINQLPQLDEASPQEALRQWLRFFLQIVLIRRPAHPYLGRIMMHELARPTAALDELVNHVMMPVRGVLMHIITALLGDAATPTHVKRITNLTIIMCVQHEIARPTLKRLSDEPPHNTRQLNRLADQLHQFILGGIRQVRADHLA